VNVVTSIGIDPGWKTLGLSVVRREESGLVLVHSETMNPSERGLFQTTDIVRNLVSELGPSVVHMERYVGYAGVHSKDSERILMMIGALEYALGLAGNIEELSLYRAIDWKTELVKLLFRKRGFDNPSTKLDKKFSIAAAKACVNVSTVGSTHEADSICLASLPFIREEADCARVKVGP